MRVISNQAMLTSVRLRKNYEVSSFTKGGSPIEGNVIVRLPASQLQPERVCLQKLVGVPIQWPLTDSEPNYAEGVVEMVVHDVQLKRETRLDGSGQKVLTGDFVVALKMSEGRIPMVFREMKAHTWGIVGGVIASALLMALTFIARRAKGAGRKVVGSISTITSTLSRIRYQKKEQPDTTSTRQSDRNVDETADAASGHAGDGHDGDK